MELGMQILEEDYAEVPPEERWQWAEDNNIKEVIDEEEYNALLDQ